MGSIPGLGRSLEEAMATHSSILAWTVPWTEEPGGLQSTGCKESDTTEQARTGVRTPTPESGGQLRPESAHIESVLLCVSGNSLALSGTDLFRFL